MKISAALYLILLLPACSSKRRLQGAYQSQQGMAGISLRFVGDSFYYHRYEPDLMVGEEGKGTFRRKGRKLYFHFSNDPFAGEGARPAKVEFAAASDSTLELDIAVVGPDSLQQVPFPTISIPGTRLAILGDPNGKGQLRYRKTAPTDTVRVTALGYQTCQYLLRRAGSYRITFYTGNTRQSQINRGNVRVYKVRSIGADRIIMRDESFASGEYLLYRKYRKRPPVPSAPPANR
jgi:hypothetical protein